MLIFSQEDLEAQKILVDFPNFKNVQPFTFETKEVTWKSFPQSKEDYQKRFRNRAKSFEIGRFIFNQLHL